MKSKKLLSFLIMFLILFNLGKVEAANICTEKKYNDLKQKAANIEMKWELKFDKSNNHYFEVSASNVDKDLMLIMSNVVYEPDENGSIIVSLPLEGGNTYQFKYYGAYYHPCVEEYIYTKNLKIPKYNKYSELEECKEYSEWEVCDKWYSGEIESQEDFYTKLEDYKNKIATGEIVVKEDNGNANTIIVISVTLIVLVAVSYIIIKKKKINKKSKI